MAHDTSIPATSQDGLRGGVRVNGSTRWSNEPAFGANGEINASSKKELMQSVGHLVRQASTSVVSRPSSIEEATMRVAQLISAYNDRSGNQFQVVGEVISDEIWETLGREGFSRKLFAVQPIAQGQMARVLVRRKDVVAYQVTTDVKIQEQRIRQGYIFPPEFYIGGYILIEDKEIAQASSDLLDQKFQDGLEATLRREDLISRALMVRGATAFNTLVLFTNFTPAVLQTLRGQVNRWGTPAATLTIAWDLWDDIIADNDFVAWWDQHFGPAN